MSNGIFPGGAGMSEMLGALAHAKNGGPPGAPAAPGAAGQRFFAEGLDDASAFFARIMEDGVIDRVNVKHLTAAGTNLVECFRVDLVEAEEIARRAVKIAHRHAEAFNRDNAYVFEPVGQNQSMGEHTHMERPSGKNEVAQTFEANEGGIAAMLMGFFTQQFRDIQLTNKNFMDRADKNERRYVERITTLEAEYSEVMILFKNLLIAEADVKGIARRAEIRGEAEKRAITELTKVIPFAIKAVMTQFTGGGPIGQLRSFAESLSTDQLLGIVAQLKEDQRGELKSLLGIDEEEMMKKMLASANAAPAASSEGK